MIHSGSKHQELDVSRLFHNLDKILVMGVVNTTPDSFSDGGKFLDPSVAVQYALRLIEEGADIIDIGGESSRPGSDPVSDEEELRRVIPVIGELTSRTRIPISIDTYKSKVAATALEMGVAIVNDISGLNADSKMSETVAQHNAGLILMHMRGSPREMQKNTVYTDLIGEICLCLADSIHRAEQAGVDPMKIMVDPGVGFGKDLEGNLLILRSVDRFRELGKPVMIGASRKSFIGKLTGAETQDRLAGSIAAAVIAVMNGAVAIRTHDARETRQAVDLAFRLRKV